MTIRAKPSKPVVHTHGTHGNQTKAAVVLPGGGDLQALSAIQELVRVKGALRATESKLQAVEKQLSLCRHSSAQLRAAAGLSAPPPPPPRHHGGHGGGHGNNGQNETESGSAIAVLSPVCADAVSWAQHVGVVRYASLYPGLNASSPARAFQLHLHLNDPTSECVDPRSAAEILVAGDGSASAFFLIFGVMVCALCNAYSLGYLHPNRRLRALLRPLGLATPLVR